MLIAALTAYYDSLRRVGAEELAPDRYSYVSVPNLAILSRDGRLVDIIPNTFQVSYKKRNGETKLEDRAKRELFPERIEVSAIRANLLEHRGEYLFGGKPDAKAGKFDADPKKLKEFRDMNLPFFAKIDDPAAQAYVRFMENWDANPDNLQLLSKCATNPYYFCFCLENDDVKFNENPAICRAIEEKLAFENAEMPCETGQCSVSGESGRLAAIHRNLKGIFGAQMSGANIVSVNMTAAESYGLEGGYNASVSFDVMKKYTSAFNYIASKRNHKIVLDDMTFLFFSQSAEDDDTKCEILNGLEDLDGLSEADPLTEQIKQMLDQAIAGHEPDFTRFQINESELFYIFGIVPNSSRLSIRFVYRNTFGEIARNLIRHHTDMRIDGQRRAAGLGNLTYVLHSPKSDKSRVSPALAGEIVQSIFKGTMYPREMFHQAVYRVRVDKDINAVRAGMIKAYLNRLARSKNNREVITMALDTERTDAAYLCGRLFAVLEKAQKDALGDVSATIKDKFFDSACTRPAAVFPKLLKLAQTHLKKNDPYFNARKIAEIMECLQAFPVRLVLEEQGDFQIGYYHQYNHFFVKKEKENGSN